MSLAFAVDDETWAAFKELWGPTPASIRLGRLGCGRGRAFTPAVFEPDAVAAFEAIRAHLIELEALARGTPQR